MFEYDLTMTTQVLVAGATVDLGSRIMRELLLRDTHMRVLTRPGSGKAQAMYGNNNRMEIVEVHYSDRSALSAAHLGVETVISSATGSLPPTSPAPCPI